MLEVNAITKYFGDNQVLRGVSEVFPQKQVNGLVGANGAGKSTLIKIISGLERQTAGKVVLDGKQCFFESAEAAYIAGIRTLQQETDVNLFTSLSVLENIILRTRKRQGFAPLVRRSDLSKAKERLALVGGQDIRLGALVSELPLPQRQRVALASALDEEARVIILDEPTAALDRGDAEHLLDVMRDIREHGASIIFISHHLSEITAISDQVTVLKDGAIADRFEHGAGTERGEAHRRIVSAMIGERTLDVNDAKERSKFTAPEEGEPVLALNDVRNGQLKGVSLKVWPGEVVVLTGLLGSGAGAVLQCVYGLGALSGGSIGYGGRELGRHSPSQMVTWGAGLVPDDRQGQGLHLEHSVNWNSSLVSLKLVTSKLGVISDQRTLPLTREVAERVQLVANDLDMPVQALSGGNQQKVVVSKWLAQKRKLLLLDEPTRGVDVGTRTQIYKLLRDLASRERMAILCATYEFDEAIHLADRIVVMRRGEVVDEVYPADVTERQLADIAMGAAA